MAGVGLGHMTKAVLGSTILVGVNASIETYVSQAAGAKKYQLAGTYLNQGRVLIVLCFIPICAILLNTEWLMVKLGQNAEVAKHAQTFVTYSLPAVLISGFNDSQKKFLNCFKKNFVPMWSNALGVILYPFWCYIFIIHLDLGILGCAVTDVVSITITYAFNLVYTFLLADIQEAVFLPGLNSLTATDSSFNEQLRIAIWSIFNSIVEGYSWQLMILVSGYLSVADQAANMVVMNLVILFYAVNVGLMHASCTLIGQSIGKNDPAVAKSYLSSLIRFCVGMMLVFNIILFFLKDQVISVYTTNPDIRK